MDSKLLFLGSMFHPSSFSSFSCSIFPPSYCSTIHYPIGSPFHHSSVPLFTIFCSIVPLFHCSTVPLFRYSAVPLFHGSLFHCSTVPLFHCSTVPLFSVSTGTLASGSPHVAKFNMAATRAGSQLFCPFRALGFVANHVPLTLQTQGTESLVTTAVGSAFHVYNVGQF